MQSWLIVERFENWKVDKANGFSFFGLSDRYRTVAAEIAEKDLVFCYVSRGPVAPAGAREASAFADIRIVRDSGLRRLNVQSYDSPFAFSISTAPLLVLPPQNWIPIKEIAADLELTRGRKEYRAMLQTSIRKLTPSDSAFLKQRLETAAKRG